MPVLKYYDPGSSSWRILSGIQGPPGEQGIQGPMGVTGATGANGADGAPNPNATAVWNDAYYMVFHWNGQPGQPTWLWGSNDGANIYVYNPANFSVADSGALAGLGSNYYARTDGVFQDLNGIYMFNNTGHGFRYPGITGGGGTANVYVTSAPTRGLQISSSSRRYKHGIGDSDIDWHRLLKVPVRTFKMDCEEPNAPTWHAFIAEEVAEAVPETAIYDGGNQVENYNYLSVIAGLKELLREAFERIEALEAA